MSASKKAKAGNAAAASEFPTAAAIVDDEEKAKSDIWDRPWAPDRLRIGQAQVDALYDAVLKGDAKAANDLVNLANFAAFTLENIWAGFDLNFLLPDFAKNREPRREILRRIARERETWPISFYCRAAKRKTTDRMLKELELGTKTPLKAVDVADDDMRTLLEQVLIPELGPPTASNAREWVQKAINYIMTTEPPGMRDALRDPHTWLHELADPERQVGKRQKAAYKRLGKWEEKKKTLHESGELSVEESEERDKWVTRIKNLAVTDAELVNGLKEALAARVKSLTGAK